MFGKTAITLDDARPATGERIYVIGDVHGEMDLLIDLLNRIEQDDLLREPRKKRLVFLGDLIDRGPDSLGVLSLLYSAQKETKRLIVLMGNHESALLESMDGNEAAQQMWLRYGGRETLASFGIDPPDDEEDPQSFAQRLRTAIPGDLVDWLQDLPLYYRSGSYFFCHAGVRPGTPLARQKPEDLLWIREEFLESPADHGAVVVHGHSICGDAVEFATNRINVDTGAYASGILSAVGLEGADRWVISTTGKPVE